MKKNIGLVLIILVIVVVSGICWSRFCKTGRYHVVFGNIQKEYTQFPLPLKTKIELVPVCIKLDTLTGQVWIYEDSYILGADGSTLHTKGFKKINDSSTRRTEGFKKINK